MSDNIDAEAQAVMAEVHAMQEEGDAEVMSAPAIFLQGVIYVQCAACLDKGRQTPIKLTVTQEDYERQFQAGEGLSVPCPACSEESHTSDGCETVISVLIAIGGEADAIDGAMEAVAEDQAPVDGSQPFAGQSPNANPPAPTPVESEEE